MRKPWLRGTALGIILSTIVYSYFYYSSGSPAKITEHQVDTFLEEKGLKKITQKEYNKLLALKNNNQQNIPATNKNESTEPKDESTQAIAYTLTIQPGMSSDQIAELLERENIIKDANEFNKYLIQNELHTRIQIGTFKLTNGMGIQELADEITR